MSAEILGRDLLAEVKEEGLVELLCSLRELQAPSNAPLGFPPFNRVLETFQNPPLTWQQQQNQTQWSTHYQAPPSARDKLPPIIEITGASACSGKTQLLYHIISMSLLPREYKDLPVNGKGDAVVVLDLSDRFSLLRLSKIMQNYVSSNWSTFSALISEHEVSSLISDSLAHLHIFRPQSTPSLLATLDSIPSYLLAQPSTHFSANRPLGLLAINDLSSFLWQDRLDADNETSLPTTSGIEKANNNLFVNRYRSLVSSLCRVQQLFSCTIVATNWGLAPVTHVAGHPSLRPHLPSVWNNFCTVKIVVERERVSKFGPGLSAEVAAKEGPQRWEAVGRSRFTGWVNWWDSEGWREEVREGVKGLEKGGSFSFSATDQGIVFVDDDDDDDDDDNDDNDDDVDDDEEG